MKHLKYVFILITISLNLLFAQNYYVDQNNASANDSNPGTVELPFKTIQAGVNVVSAGDTVIIKGDTDSTSSQAIYNVSGNGITTKNNGSSGKYIVVKNYPGDAVVIHGDGTGDGIELNNSYNEFSGIKFTDFSQATEGDASKTNIIIENCEFTNTKTTGLRLRNIDSLVVRDMYVHHCFDAGISMRGCNNVLIERVKSAYNYDDKGIWGDADGFHSLDGNNINFIDCIAYSNTEDGFDITSNGIIKNCISANHPACNIKLWRRDRDGFAPKTMIIINTIVYGAGEAGIKISNGAQLKLFNSVIYNNGQEGIAFRGVKIEQKPAVVTSYIVNNIISGNGMGGIEVLQSGQNKNKVIADYNLYYKNGNENKDLFSDNNFINGDPQFMDAQNANFYLKQTSPAINKGMTVKEFNKLYYSPGFDISKDFDGKARSKSGNYTIGAFTN